MDTFRYVGKGVGRTFNTFVCRIVTCLIRSFTWWTFITQIFAVGSNCRRVSSLKAFKTLFRSTRLFDIAPITSRTSKTLRVVGVVVPACRAIYAAVTWNWIVLTFFTLNANKRSTSALYHSARRTVLAESLTCGCIFLFGTICAVRSFRFVGVCVSRTLSAILLCRFGLKLTGYARQTERRSIVCLKFASWARHTFG